jgi:hypothetical protein
VTPVVRRISALLLGALIGANLGACASRGPTFGFEPDRAREQRIQAEYAPYRQRGDGAISGRAWLELPDGRRVLASRSGVKLTPVTSLSRDFIDEALRSGDWSSQVLARERAVVWTTRTDEQGHFDFTMLPPGDYYIICTTSWRDTAGHTQDTILVVQTHIGEGELREVVLVGNVTPQDPR